MITQFGAASWAGIMYGIGALPDNFYVALLNDQPGDGWDGTVLQTLEPTDAAYARQPLATVTDFTLAEGGFVINAVPLDYGSAGEDWGNITHYGLTDDPLAGELWLASWFLDSIYVQAGSPVSLAIGSLYHALGNQLAPIAE